MSEFRQFLSEFPRWFVALEAALAATVVINAGWFALACWKGTDRGLATNDWYFATTTLMLLLGMISGAYAAWHRFGWG